MKGLPTREAFEKLINDKGVYSLLPSETEKGRFRKYRVNFPTLEKMQEVLKDHGYKMVQKELWKL